MILGQTLGILGGLLNGQAMGSVQCAVIWDQFTSQIHAGWDDSYHEIKKLLPEIKDNHAWLKTRPPRYLKAIHQKPCRRQLL